MSRSRAKELAHAAAESGSPNAWFEQLYREAEGNTHAIPWADLRPNEKLVQWLSTRSVDARGRSACVVGAGLGDDAEALAALGFRVTAFDLSETAIQWAKDRFPETTVKYEVADLLRVSSTYPEGFDLVFEAYTIQSMPLALREAALLALCGLVRKQGTLVVIARSRPNGSIPAGPPWPLSSEELAPLDAQLTRRTFEEYFESNDPDVPRILAEYLR